MGSTWGQYVQTLDNDSAYLASVGDPTTDVSQLLSFEIEKANAGYFAQSLTSAVTADDLPAPGMDLTFVQSYPAVDFWPVHAGHSRIRLDHQLGHLGDHDG